MGEETLKMLFNHFKDYVILHDIKTLDKQIHVFYEYILYEDVDSDIDIDAEYYNDIVSSIDKHFKIYSRELLKLNTLEIDCVVFESSMKKYIFKFEGDFFLNTHAEKFSSL